MKTHIRSTLALLLTLFLFACASKPTVNQKFTNVMLEGGLIAEETERGVVVYLPAVFFEFDKAVLTNEASEKVRYISAAVNEEYIQDRRIAVEGHTDAKGTEEYNMKLSKARAQSVTDALVFSQVATDRIDLAWFGESAPRAPNTNVDGSDNPEGRAKNRRVEFIILNPDQ